MAVSRRVVGLTLETLADLPPRCRGCVFWELDPVSRDHALRAGDTAFEKEAWVSALLLEWGSCGTVVYVDDVAAGYALYAPPGWVPRAGLLPTSPVSADAVLLVTAHVLPEHRGAGLGRLLVQAVTGDLVRRGVRAVEVFGDLAPQGPACLLPADYLLAVGFTTVRPHPRFPRLRLELGEAQPRQEDVEVALERLLDSVPRQGVLRPAGV